MRQGGRRGAEDRKKEEKENTRLVGNCGVGRWAGDERLGGRGGDEGLRPDVRGMFWLEVRGWVCGRSDEHLNYAACKSLKRLSSLQEVHGVVRNVALPHDTGSAASVDFDLDLV